MEGKVKIQMTRLLTIFGLFIFLSAQVLAQDSNPPANWFNQDPMDSQLNGVSTEKAYEFLKDKPSKSIIVAVIDSGIDIDHEDLRDVIWTNSDEIAGNGIDDDGNGFVDDIHGWNFIGGKDGNNVDKDTYEVTREYARLKDIYEGKKPSKKADYQYWLEIKESYEQSFSKANNQYLFYDSLQTNITRFNQLMTAYVGTDKLTIEQLKQVQSEDELINLGTAFMGNILSLIGDADVQEVVESLDGAVDHYGSQVEYGYNTEFDPRGVVGDDRSNLSEVGYGNNDVKGEGTESRHGTHVAGIIGADRTNDIGIEGIADNVKIMAVRAVPDGDERDKDVANAIRYAVDNGARIINMSFGKGYSPDKKYVDEAVRYAESKGVLLVHAAGNSGFNTEENRNYPTRELSGKKQAANWLEIGASSWGNDDRLAASFSNYGKTTVDVFAPGVSIYSTVPGSEYENLQGTSMASPVVAGVAAMLMSYYPHLSATDVKEIILSSSRKFDGLEVIKPGTKDEMVDFSELSVSGGVVNAYEAVKLAESRSIASSN